MKKLYSLIMVFALLVTFAACGNKTNNNSFSSASQQPSTPNSAAAEESSDTSAPAETGSESLVVYFSWSGNTENVAKSIQSQTNSDIFEIVPVIPYSDDYDTVLDLAQEEQKNNARPEISGSIETLEQYDVIYVGLPKMEQG